MKHILIFILLTSSLSFFGQKSRTYESYNKFIQVKGTPYVIAHFKSYGKINVYNSSHLLFINTESGDTNKLSLPNKGDIIRFKQVKIDSLGVNMIVASGQSVERDGREGYGWDDPQQIYIISKDGSSKKQLTEDSFDAEHWQCNDATGTIVVSGKYDSNGDGKINKYDKNTILLYNLQTLELIKKI